MTIDTFSKAVFNEVTLDRPMSRMDADTRPYKRSSKQTISPQTTEEHEMMETTKIWKDVDQHNRGRKFRNTLSELLSNVTPSLTRIRAARPLSGLLPMMKTLTYTVLLVIFMVSLLFNKGSLVLMTSTIAHLTQKTARAAEHEVDNSRHFLNSLTTVLILCLCIPHGITFLVELYRCLSSGRQWPCAISILLILVLETLQTLSTCTVLFLVLPEMDMISALCITELMVFIPELLLSWGHDRTKNCQLHQKRFALQKPSAGHEPSSDDDQSKGCPLYFISVLALLGQLVGLSLLFGSNTPGPFSGTPPSEAVETMAASDAAELQHRTASSRRWYYRWPLLLAVVVKSATWWQTSIGSDFLNARLRRWKLRVHAVRRRAAFFTSAWNIAVLVAFPYVASALSAAQFAHFTFALPKAVSYQDILYILPVFMNWSSALIAYIAALLACKVFLHKPNVNFPLLILTPLTTGLIILQCQCQFIPELDLNKWLAVEGIAKTKLLFADSTWQLACCVLLWISVFVVVLYVSQSKHGRREVNARWPVQSFYDPILFAQRVILAHHDLSEQSDVGDNGDTTAEVSGHSPTVQSQHEEFPPMVYACATMWHENKNEMIQLQKSIFRMDDDQKNRFNSRLTDKTTNDRDYYEYESHIFFDDAFQMVDGETTPNQYVKQFCEIIDEAASCIHSVPIKLGDPDKMATPYGGRLTWTLPGGTKLVVHLKDKSKIRHKKRWSQCMYMYYLLCYKLVGLHEDTALGRSGDFLPDSPFSDLPKSVYKKAQNTFVLTLDGDVDFKPEAVRRLVDQMKKNEKVASVCGRIRPIGKGLVVWFQQFEYEVRHWLQQTAEKLYGCVLCSAGCFSLFRASALLDNNVMRRYCEVAKAPMEMVQFDQGEDRWLCTLLLQQGHRITYCAEAEALTYVPETFNELYNQRRRWVPSTVANIVDLLTSFKRTTTGRDYMTSSFMFYQFSVFSVYILSPSWILTALAACVGAVLDTGPWPSYALAAAPIALFLVATFSTAPNTQVVVAQFCNAAYSATMSAAVLVKLGAVASEWLGATTALVLLALSAALVVDRLLRSGNRSYLLPIFTFLSTCMSMYLTMLLYSLCNLNVVSWGTREKSDNDPKPDNERDKRQQRRTGGTRRMSRLVPWLDIFKTSRRINLEDKRSTRTVPEAGEQLEVNNNIAKEREQSKNWKLADERKPNEFELRVFGQGRVESLSEGEAAFWRLLIRDHLHPIEGNPAVEARIERELKSLRTKLVVAYLVLNFACTVMTFYFLPVDVLFPSSFGTAAR